MSKTVTITRKHLVVLIAAFAAGSVVVSGGTAWAVGTFSDVPESNPFYDEIEWGAENGIIEGFPDGTFRPSNNVTRQAVAAFMARYNNSIHIVTETDSPGAASSFFLSASCPAGERVLGGGGFTSLSGMVMTDSYLSDDDRWAVRWESKTGASVSPDITVTATCAPGLVP